MSCPDLVPGTVWFADLDPTQGHEQAGDRPVLIVSSAFHLELTGGDMATVLPLTTTRRPGWVHRIRLGQTSWVITEQVRTLATRRLRCRAAELDPDAEEYAEVRRALAHMLDL
ncbi:hypothetical protein GCM10027174_45160 [Salinifilum aidingensis]